MVAMLVILHATFLSMYSEIYMSESYMYNQNHMYTHQGLYLQNYHNEGNYQNHSFLIDKLSGLAFNPFSDNSQALPSIF